MGKIRNCYICGREFRTGDALGRHHENYHVPKKLVIDPATISEDVLAAYERMQKEHLAELADLMAGLPSKGQS